jgi:required for meiotic nuclear division protein 1
MLGCLPAETLALDAFAIASTVPVKQLESYFSPEAARVKTTKTTLVVRYGERCWAVAHDFGVLVFIGVEKDERQRVMKRLLDDCRNENRPPLEESFLVELRPDSTPSARFDRVVLPELDARSAELVALAVGQSVGMEYYEDTVDTLVAQLENAAKRMADTGRLSDKSRELLRFIGRGMAIRTQVVHTLALLDAPALAWDDEPLDKLYRDLRASFAIEDRYRALDQKLDMIQDNLELFVDLSQHRRSVLLEVAVIVLIAFEIVMAFFAH